MKHKAIVLLSGGLDSILAAKLMMELGYEVECLHYYIAFAVCSGGADCAERAMVATTPGRHDARRSLRRLSIE